MNSDPRPILVFDGDCGFCRFWIRRWQARVRDLVRFAPSQEVAVQFPDVPPERFNESVVLIDASGNHWHGARAVFGALACSPKGAWLLRMYESVPLFGRIAEFLYRFVAGHRPAFTALTRLLWGRSSAVPESRLVSWVFLRALALVYLAAFLSLWPQIQGLVGSNGILPASEFLHAVARQIGPSRFFLVPTLAWLDSSDAALKFLCVGGCTLSLVALLGFFEGPVFALLWLFYLSLVSVGQEFLGFQWDNLLLESGLLAIMLASWSWRMRPSTQREPRQAIIWLFRILLFKLMLMSGIAKLASGDPTWHGLTALSYHYETQPLPTWIGWYAHQLPLWFGKVSLIVMFAIELVAPFGIFLPRRPRLLACGAIVFLQIAILLTGNYGFFNWLTIVLCLLLLDDAALRAIFRMKPTTEGSIEHTGKSRARSSIGSVLLAGYLVIYVLVCGGQIAGGFASRGTSSSILTDLEGMLWPIHSINRYGLFSLMTTTRPEIIVEGSDDGHTWLPYEFNWKPGDLSRRPGFVAPHMPRLDWQMWFAALGSARQERWFSRFLDCLLRGSPSVNGLLATNPFPDHPPHFVRAMLYEYHFTDLATKRATGEWWRRELLGTYAEPVSR